MTATTATTATPTSTDRRRLDQRRSAVTQALAAIGAAWHRIGELGQLGPDPDQLMSRHTGGRI